MLWLYLLALALLVGVVAALLGRWEGAAVPGADSLAADESDVDELLRRRASTDITADDLNQVGLDSAVRGYRMDQVDRLLDALRAQLAQHEAGAESLQQLPAKSHGVCEEPGFETAKPLRNAADEGGQFPA